MKNVKLTFVFDCDEKEQLSAAVKADLEELGVLTTGLTELAYNTSRPAIALKGLVLSLAVIADHVGVARELVAKDLVDTTNTFAEAIPVPKAEHN